MKTVTEHLLALADAGNAAFTARLAPGVDPDRMLGCRIPQLRRLARTLRGTPEAAAFLTQLPHRYYDENNLHGILLGHIRPTGEALDALERFLPHIDNWATCDITACGMKTLGRAPAAALPRIYEWLASRRTYTVRFGVVALLAHYLDEKFDTHHLDRLTALPGGEYYVDMAVAWAFSVALVKHFEQTLPYFTQRAARPPGAQQGVAEGPRKSPHRRRPQNDPATSQILTFPALWKPTDPTTRRR